ncbi:complex I subunit 5 family protein [Natronospora cellulosivora (SeqCode)]
MNTIILLAILMPVILMAFSFLVPVLDQHKVKIIPGISLFIAVLNFILSIFLIYQVRASGNIVYHFGGWSPPWGIEFLISDLEAFMALLITGVYLLVLIYASPNLEKEVNPRVFSWYYILLFLLQASLIGMTFTNDLFNFFVFVEISAITSVAIVSVKDDKGSIEASIKYLFFSSIGSAFLLFAIGLLYMISGNLNLDMVGAVLQENYHVFPQTVTLSLIFIFIGLALKAALFPLHIWLPDAYSNAPIASTAILSGLVGKAYIIAFIKIIFKVYRMNILQESNLLALILPLSALAIIFGSIFAIGQTKIKRMLAYSSVAQVGYIFLGIGLASVNGLTGGLLHVFNHALIKILLFLAVGVIIHKTGKDKISDFNGIAYKYPFTMIVFSLAALAMIGIPPLNGFISKWILALATLEANQGFYLVIILISSLMNAIYYLPIIIRAFFGNPDKTYKWEFSNLGIKVCLPMAIFAIAILVFGLFPNLPLLFIEKASISLFSFN